MAPSEARLRKLEGELQRVLAELISREVKDPRVGNVTITAVELTADLSLARVYFVPFASQHSPEEVCAGLTRAGGFLRGEVGRRLRLRQAPRLEFRFDESPERAARLTDLIERAVARDREAGLRRDGDETDSPPGS
ncbi:MAG: 30S ribosome-binding factor RbfA [Pseudomonadota bacterium]|jgi:ribosome-binding factor A|nr:MAG: 30S ribosome-binding factor RbfA [Pseudomonadota bacterium]